MNGKDFHAIAHRHPLRSILASLIVLAAALPSASFSQGAPTDLLTFTDLRGEKHENVKVLRVEEGSLVIMTSSGIIRLAPEVLPPEIRTKFAAAPSPAAPVANAPQQPAPAPEPPMPIMSSDEVELAKLRADIERVGGEIKNLESNVRALKAEHEQEYQLAKARNKVRYDLERQAYDKKMRHRRNPGEPPVLMDPESDPAVAKIQARIDNFAAQIKQRQDWLQDKVTRERTIGNRLADIRKAEMEAERANAERDARLKLEQMRHEEQKRLLAMQEERTRLLAERAAQEKKEEEDRLRAKKEILNQITAECRGIEKMIQGGDLREAFLKLQGIYSDRNRWDQPGASGGPVIGALALTLFDAAREQNELAVGTSCMRIALSIDKDSPQLAATLIKFFDDGATMIRGGDLDRLVKQQQFIKNVGLDGENFVLRKNEELSNLALDSGWQALKRFDVATAGASVKAARRLWDRNPRLGWLRNTINGSFVLVAIVGLLAVFKGVEKLYWWLNRS